MAVIAVAMVLDYSKWDALELSDDSDFEPHPNVDKKSFIRAKQNQIHQQRHDRRHQIETLKYERIINDGLLRRIDSLLAALRSHEATARDPNEFLMQALIESAGDPDQDQAPPAPEGVHTQTAEQPRYSQMMASLVDQVKKEVDESKTGNWHKAYVKGIEGHKKKIAELQKALHQKLAELEKEESRKITSDSIHTGFNVSSVSKDKENADSSTKEKPKPKAVELLNPGASGKGQLQRHDSAQSSGADGDIEDEEADAKDDEHIEPTQLGKAFAKIQIGDYKSCLQYISSHRAVVAERETDGLLVEGFNAQMDGHAAYARQCVHQALLLQYCRSLGKDGVGLFFKRYFLSPSKNPLSHENPLTPRLARQNQHPRPPSAPSLPRRRLDNLHADPHPRRRNPARALHQVRGRRRRRADPAARRRARHLDPHQHPASFQQRRHRAIVARDLRHISAGLAARVGERELGEGE